MTSLPNQSQSSNGRNAHLAQPFRSILNWISGDPVPQPSSVAVTLAAHDRTPPANQADDLDAADCRAITLDVLADVGVSVFPSRGQLTALADLAERRGFDRGEFYDAVMAKQQAVSDRILGGLDDLLDEMRGMKPAVVEPLAILGCGEYATRIMPEELGG